MGADNEIRKRLEKVEGIEIKIEEGEGEFKVRK